MGIDTTGHTTNSFYDGHGHPFLLNGWGMARPFRIGVTGGPGCCRKPGQSPSLGDGACRCQCATGGTRSTTLESATGQQVRPNLPVLPKLLGTSCEAVDPSEHCHCLGTRLQRRRWARIRGTPNGRKATMAAASARKAPHDQLNPAGLSRMPSTTRATLTPVMRTRS